MSNAHPARIVCLSAEAVDILYQLGCGEQIVGVTGYATEPPAARRKPRVSGFSTAHFDKIDALRPDLVITFSDVQAPAASELIRRGHTVLATNQRSLEDIFQTIVLIGKVVGCARKAEQLADKLRREIFKPAASSPLGSRLKVYFEEWNDPLITGIRWVSELIEAAGGTDIFSEFRDRSRAPDRVVSSEEVIHRQPDLIFASWCGKRVSKSAICARPGWDQIPAVRQGQVHEIKSGDILQPGPGLLRGFRQLLGILQAVSRGN